MICLPKIKTAELSTYGNFAKCHQAHFRVSRVGLGTRLTSGMVIMSKILPGIDAMATVPQLASLFDSTIKACVQQVNSAIQ